MAGGGVCGPAQAEARRSWRRQALKIALEMKCELAQSRCDAIVCSLVAHGLSIAVTSRRWCRSFTVLFGGHHLYLG